MNLASSRQTILITGASGFIGARLAIFASAQGYLVKTLSRSTQSIPPSIPFEHRYGGSLPNDIPAKALENVDAVVHCAAWVKSGAETAQAVNVEGTLRLAEMALQYNVGTFVFLSSQSAKPDATSDYGRSKYSAEEALLSRFSKTRLQIIILRPGLVTGFGHQGVYQRLCRMVDSWPILPLLNGGKAIIQPIHVDDLSAAILKCLTISDQIRGRVLNLGHPQGITLGELVQVLAYARKGRRKYTVSILIDPIIGIVRIAEYLRLSLPITSENLKGLQRVQKMETQADMDLLGVPARSIEVILRDHINYDPSVLREATLLGRYLLRTAPNFELQHRYADAIERLKITLDRDEHRLWRIVERYPSTLKMIDAGLALEKPHGGMRRKIYTLLAILETSPEYCARFLPKPCSSLQIIRLSWIGLRAALAAVLGFIFIKAIKVRPN